MLRARLIEDPGADVGKRQDWRDCSSAWYELRADTAVYECIRRAWSLNERCCLDETMKFSAGLPDDYSATLHSSKAQDEHKDLNLDFGFGLCRLFQVPI